MRLSDSGLWGGGEGCPASPFTVPRSCARRVLTGAGNGGHGGCKWWHQSQVSPLTVSLAHSQAGPAPWEKPSFVPASVMEQPGQVGLEDPRGPPPDGGGGPVPVLQVVGGRQAGPGAPGAGQVAPSSKDHDGRAVPSCHISSSQERSGLWCCAAYGPLFTWTLLLVPRALRGNPAGFPDRTSARRFWWHAGPPGRSVSVLG